MYVFAEDPGSGSGPPRGFGCLISRELIQSEFIFINDVDPPSTLYHFANADLVVNIGKRLVVHHGSGKGEKLNAESFKCRVVQSPPPPPPAPPSFYMPTSWTGSSFSLITELISPKPIMLSTPLKERADCYVACTAAA